MKICRKCNIEKQDLDFNIKKHKNCKNGIYISGQCKDCERDYTRNRDRKKRVSGDRAYIQKRRDAVKKYRKSPKGKAVKKKADSKHKEKRHQYYLDNSKRYYQQRLDRLKKEISNVTDEYVIVQLQNPHRKIRYTREFLKQNPHLIEEHRIKILNHRLKKKIEELSDYGFCVKCGKRVLKSEFRKQKTTDKKREHIIRLCIVCRKENSKLCWQQYINKKKAK